jgi:mannose-6-phosphate isomerase class I
MRIDGQEFSNGPTCSGVSFAVADASLDIARIKINGRYPETGWAINHASHEMVYVLEGQGELIKEDYTTELAAGDAIHVPPETNFAWNGHMTIIMSCNPPFEPNQYEVKKGVIHEIQS